MSGRITHPTELPECRVAVTIEEYERDWETGEYSDEAFPGTFAYSPDYGTSLSLTLHFRQRDFEVLMPVILGSPTVILSVSLRATKAEIAATTKEYLFGEITPYTFLF